MSEKPTVPTMHVPTFSELNRLVEQQNQNAYPSIDLQPRNTHENNADRYFHAWESGVHDKALEEHDARIDLYEEATVNEEVWNQPEARPEIHSSYEIPEAQIFNDARVAGRALTNERRNITLANLN